MQNKDRHKSEYNKCKACKNKTKCNANEPYITCEVCNKFFYGKTCLDNHIINNNCKEHSYKCKTCHRFYKTKHLPMDEHDCECDKVKCGNCKYYVNMDHRCYMLKKDIKQHSEKYVYFDFGTRPGN